MNHLLNTIKKVYFFGNNLVNDSAISHSERGGFLFLVEG
jgi:hypothetical protein